MSSGNKVILALLVFRATSSFAQVDTGSILGTIKDTSGAVMPGVKVTLTNDDTGLAITSLPARQVNIHSHRLRSGTIQ